MALFLFPVITCFLNNIPGAIHQARQSRIIGVYSYGQANSIDRTNRSRQLSFGAKESGNRIDRYHMLHDGPTACIRSAAAKQQEFGTGGGYCHNPQYGLALSTQVYRGLAAHRDAVGRPAQLGKTVVLDELSFP